MEQQPDVNKKKDWLKKPVALWLVGLLMIIAFSGGVYAGGGAPWEGQVIIKGADATSTSTVKIGNVSNTDEAIPKYLQKDVDFNLYWDVWNVLKNKYYSKDIADTKLFYGSLQGLVASLGDPYSVFMTPTDADQFQKDLEGSFEGIGAEIAVKNNQLIVVAPLDESPAMKAGLRPKDWILKIDGVVTDGMNANEAVKRIRGEGGTTVTLTIYREGLSQPLEVKIVRDTIVVKSVSWEYKNNGSTIWLKVRQFNDDTMPLLDKAITEIHNKPQVKNIVLDLRNNPGGYLESAVKMAGEWDGSAIVVSEKNRNGSEANYTANKPARLANYKTVVLVDGGSASASEIVAGALHDWGKAQIVGIKTFGKGSVQELDNLSDGSQIKLTIAKWFTPKGINIDEQGIEPDIKIELTEEDYNKDRDPQLDKALELLR